MTSLHEYNSWSSVRYEYFLSIYMGDQRNRECLRFGKSSKVVWEHANIKAAWSSYEECTNHYSHNQILRYNTRYFVVRSLGYASRSKFHRTRLWVLFYLYMYVKGGWPLHIASHLCVGSSRIRSTSPFSHSPYNSRLYLSKFLFSVSDSLLGKLILILALSLAFRALLLINRSLKHSDPISS